MSAKVKFLSFIFLIAILIAIPSLLMAHPKVTLLDKNGNPIVNELDSSDTVTAANGTIYKKGPAFSPKQTCGKCHDYTSINKAYHFMTGAWGPDNNADGSSNLSDDLWVSKNRGKTPLHKYLTNAYGHLESPGQYGAW